MEKKFQALAMAVAMVLLLVSVTEMGSVAAAGLCNMTNEGLTACRPSISTVKPTPNPTETCCTALAKADFSCLCGYKNSGMLQYLGIDPKLAMRLPEKCNIAPTTQC